MRSSLKKRAVADDCLVSIQYDFTKQGVAWSGDSIFSYAVFEILYGIEEAPLAIFTK